MRTKPVLNMNTAMRKRVRTGATVLALVVLWGVPGFKSTAPNMKRDGALVSVGHEGTPADGNGPVMPSRGGG